MADRLDYYFRQKVTEAELDLGFELLEKADHNLAADIGVYGVVSGAVPTQHAPIADLTIDLSAPGRAYDRLGQRVFFGTGQTVNLAVDLTGIPTDVSNSSQERWLGVFIRFKRLMSDPRTDGNSQQVFFRRDESFEIVVRQGALGSIGAAPKVALVEGELLLCDVHRRAGQTQILSSDIDTSRRQSFMFALGNAVQVFCSLWSAISAAANTVQSAFDSVDQLLAGHFAASAKRHKAQDVDYTPHGFVASSNLKAALDELLDALSSTTLNSAGASKIGADAVTGTPHSLPLGTVDAQLSSILGWLNAHEKAAAAAHAASAISATAHSFVASTSVQAQLQEIGTDLQSQASPASGASLIGNDALTGAPYALAAGSLRDQVRADAQHLNTHAASGDHDARYLREVFRQTNQLAAGETRKLTTLDDTPHLVQSAYAYVGSDGWPEATTYAAGSVSSLIRTWATKVAVSGGYDCELWVQNQYSAPLFITVGAYRVG